MDIWSPHKKSFLSSTSMPVGKSCLGCCKDKVLQHGMHAMQKTLTKALILSVPTATKVELTNQNHDNDCKFKFLIEKPFIQVPACLYYDRKKSRSTACLGGREKLLTQYKFGTERV